MNSTGLSPCQSIRVPVVLHGSGQKEDQSVGNGITQALPQAGQNVQSLTHRGVSSVQEVVSMINKHNGGVESSKASEDDYSDYPFPVLRREYQELQRLIVIRDRLTEIRNNGWHAEPIAETNSVVNHLIDEANKLRTLDQLRVSEFSQAGIEPPPASQNWKKYVREVAIQIIGRIIPCISGNHGR